MCPLTRRVHDLTDLSRTVPIVWVVGFFGSSHVFWRFIFPVNNAAYNARFYVTLFVKWCELYPMDQERSEPVMATEPNTSPNSICVPSFNFSLYCILDFSSSRDFNLSDLRSTELFLCWEKKKKKSFFSLSVTIRWCENTKLCVTVACYFKNSPSFLTLQHARFSGI